MPFNHENILDKICLYVTDHFAALQLTSLSWGMYVGNVYYRTTVIDGWLCFTNYKREAQHRAWLARALREEEQMLAMYTDTWMFDTVYSPASD